MWFWRRIPLTSCSSEKLKAYGLNHFVKRALERQTGKPHQPISLAADCIHTAPFENIALFSSNGAPNDKAFRTPPADLTALVSGSEWARALVETLLKRQEKLNIWMFESKAEVTPLLGGDVQLLGPDPELVDRLNSKIWQYETFGKLIPVADHRVCDNEDGLKTALNELEQICTHGMFVTRSRSAGGAQSMVCQQGAEALERFADGTECRYLISRYIPHEYDPTVLAVVGNEENVYVAGVADMHILDGNKFRGSTFPSILPPETQEALREHTKTVGRVLGKLGFRGIFGCDYIVTEEGDIYFIEVNPRKQGTTMEFCCTLEQQLPKDAPSLFDLEAHAILHNAFPEDMVEPRLPRRHQRRTALGNVQPQSGRLPCHHNGIPASGTERTSTFRSCG